MSKLDDLKELLKELFQLDQPDLDFGIYRIMHYRAAEIESFLEKDLLPQVRAALDAYSDAQRKELKRLLETAREDAAKLGVDPDTVPKVAELKAKIGDAAETDRMETEVYSDLYRFFRRYYSNGDFLSLRRRHAGEVYSIPYAGEEVKLHWANADQYYIKNSERFTNYAFKIGDGRRVRFELVAATTEKSNNKAAQDAARRYFLADDYIAEETTSDGADELVIRFEYRPGEKGDTQKNLNADTVASIANDSGHLEWRRALLEKAPTAANPDRTVFEKHLAIYTTRRSSDYFIHKDLGGFLRRELDFFIKNEIVHLDDIESESAPRVERYLAKVRAIRLVATKIIAFLAQLEEFQKKLWLKKKFVIGEAAIATIDRVDPAFYSEIASNDSQLDEWATAEKQHSALRNARADDAELAKYFEKNPNLVVDSRHFDSEFLHRLRKVTPDLDAFYSGTLFHGENHHALTALRRKLFGQVNFFYLDPPYNTGSDDFLYKDSYQYSSWMCMMFDRLHLARELLANDGAVAVSIDQHSLGLLRQLMDMVFGEGNIVSTITVQRATVSGPKVINPGVVNVCDYVLLYAKDRRAWTGNAVYSERLRDSRYNTYIRNRDKDPAHWEFVSLLEAFADHLGLSKSKLKRELGDDFEERIHSFVLDNSDAVAQPCLVRPGMVSAEFREKLRESAERPDDVVFFPRKGLSDVYLRNSKLLLFYSNKTQTVGKRRITAERASDIWTDVLPNDIHNEGGVTLGKGKKPEALLARLVALASAEGDLVADFFLGSGTLAAVAQKMGRRWVGIEMADYFESVPLQRMKNVLGGETRGVSDDFGWRGGGAFDFLRLESYDDSLDNIELVRQDAHDSLLTKNGSLREEYVLKYMLDVESSGSILNVNKFSDPWSYQMRITRDGESTLRNVDLVETFNLLLGLRVRRSGFDKDIVFVVGSDPEGSEILVIWRRLETVDSETLNSWFEKQGFAAGAFDKVYANGDNLLGTLRGESDRWTVHLIEEAFHRLMFEMDEG